MVLRSERKKLWLVHITCLLWALISNVCAQDVLPTVTHSMAPVTSSPFPTPTTNPLTATLMMTTSSPPTQNSVTTPAPTRPCGEGDSNSHTMIGAFAALMFVFMLTTCLLLFIVCYLCFWIRRNKKVTEIKQFVFEEGVRPTELWVDDNTVNSKTGESQLAIESIESTTFSPPPGSKHRSMSLPESRNGLTQSLPIQPIEVKSPSTPNKIKPKRVAPPPPKWSMRKKSKNKAASKTLEETSEYAVPSVSPYLTPVSHGNSDHVYAVPKPQKKGKWSFPHIYKTIDVSKVQPPNPYAELQIKTNTQT